MCKQKPAAGIMGLGLAGRGRVNFDFRISIWRGCSQGNEVIPFGRKQGEERSGG